MSVHWPPLTDRAPASIRLFGARLCCASLGTWSHAVYVEGMLACGRRQPDAGRALWPSASPNDVDELSLRLCVHIFCSLSPLSFQQHTCLHMGRAALEGRPPFVSLPTKRLYTRLQRCCSSTCWAFVVQAVLQAVHRAVSPQHRSLCPEACSAVVRGCMSLCVCACSREWALLDMSGMMVVPMRIRILV